MIEETKRLNKEEILSSAKNIMDNFMDELDKCSIEKEEYGKIRKTNIRTENKSNSTDEQFIKRIFDNAPKKRDGYIIAETQNRSAQ